MIPYWTAPAGWNRWVGRFDSEMNVVTDLPVAIFHVRVVYVGDPAHQVQVEQFDAAPGTAGVAEVRTPRGGRRVERAFALPRAVLQRLEVRPGDPIFMDVRRKHRR
jgi:hypothetical protein